MEFKPLSTDYKDEILSDVNLQRKYRQIVNEDGTISLQDMTAYEQEGSIYSAKDINEERQAINDIYANKVVSLEEASLVTEPGFFCDALVVSELNKNLIDRISKVGTYELLADTKSADYISVPVDFGKYKAYLLMALADSYTRPLVSITIPAIYAKDNTAPDRIIRCSDGEESNIYAAYMYFEPSTSQIKVRSKNATYCRVRLYGIL